MRVQLGKTRHRSKKRLFKEAKGNVGGRRRLFRTVKEVVVRARCHAYIGRRLRKRDFRALWITRLSAACVQRGFSYSRFIHALNQANITLNRKMLSELAISHPQVFDEVVERCGLKVAS
ncbi:MAG: 50S ribosomal protein L20 [Planctomycetota bacterium]|nr:50S ribosomal protein L20 [Planctomycetota bacterium]MDA1212813.1 50S ribosomal protein L20 [Planctomycetota bacterium]